jgi:sulfate adenylyltransferase subunit 2
MPVQASARKLSQLRQLEAESIQIIREAAAEFDNPVMMYSVGKDSSVMLRLAEKAFAPGPLPFPLLHVDTTWKFQDMYRYRDTIEATVKAELIKYTNAEGVAMGMNPFDFGSKKYTDIMKTEALKQALSKYEFDCAFGGARRDEEKSRAKERIFSFRDSHHQWDPKNQRPELWNIFNAKIKKGENVRVFPLSNWTELDVWLYVWLEGIPVVPLYFAKERPVVERSGTWILVDDDRMRLEPREEPQMKKVRFRTLGCYPLSGAVESEADTVPKVIQEMLLNRFSERQGRLIDFDEEGSMEVKKREGYF